MDDLAPLDSVAAPERVSTTKLAGVRLSEGGPTGFYRIDSLELGEGDFCLVEAPEEEAVGRIVGFEFRCSGERCDGGPHPSVLRKATDEEVEKWRRLKQREREAMALCKEKVAEHKLPMGISSVRILEKRNRIAFHFTADHRIDFRALVRDLATALRARIELWQIGVRDEAKRIDGCGICGRRLCCSGWIKGFKTISIRMAKDQDLVLSPSKLSGNCGRLMCCLQYEHAQYREMKRELPPLGAVIESEHMTGEVVDRRIFGQWLAVRDREGNVYQVFAAEVRQIVSMPEKGKGAARASDDGGPGARAAAPYVGRGGTPPRPPSAVQRERDSRLASHHEGLAEPDEAPGPSTMSPGAPKDEVRGRQERRSAGPRRNDRSKDRRRGGRREGEADRKAAEKESGQPARRSSRRGGSGSRTRGKRGATGQDASRKGQGAQRGPAASKSEDKTSKGKSGADSSKRGAEASDGSKQGQKRRRRWSRSGRRAKAKE